MTVSVYNYLDYRRYIADAWAELRAASTRHSYRWFSRKAGLGSPSYLKLVLDGKRNLTDDTARRFAKGFGLDDSATRFFTTLVRMNQARTTEARSRAYEELAALPRYREAQRLERSQYQYYARWYCVPIRELAARDDFVEDPAWIASQLRPAIKPREALAALNLLEELGLLVRDDAGRLVQAEPLLSTGPELRVLAARRFHQQMLRRAEQAMDSVDLAEREVGGVTVRLTRAQVRALKRRMYEVRQSILQMDGSDDDDQAVYHFGFQLFPVTQWPASQGDDR